MMFFKGKYPNNAVKPNNASPQVTMKPARILIVEDERIVAEDTKEILEIAGYEICGIASSGELAVSMAEQHRPHLILMDMTIHGEMDGIETARLIRERIGIPVVFVTAYSNQSVLDRAKEVEPLGYVIKPFEDPYSSARSNPPLLRISPPPTQQ